MDVDLALKQCVELGTFGRATRPERAKFKYFREEESPRMTGYNSKVCFGRIVYSADGNDLITEPLIVKTILKSNCDVPFTNEISVYSKILPFLGKFDSDRSGISELVPKFYYGNVTVSPGGADHAIVIMENLTAISFEPSRDGFFLDFEHLSLAMVALGQLHVRSYLAKRFDAERFEERMNRLQQTLENPSTSTPGYTEGCALHCMEVLRDANPVCRTKLRGLRSITDNFAEYVRSTYSKSKRSSIAVFCHGDLVRNNLLFKYSDDGRPIDVKLFDFGAARYCSPAFDLCNLLYLSTDQRTRDKHWDELLGLYHRSMLNFSARAATVVPSLELIVSEFALYAPHMYALTACYVLPVVSGSITLMSNDKPSQYSTKTQYCLELIRSSSESAIRVTIEVLTDMIERGFVQ